MSYSEIMMAINSDIKKPLNRLIEELSDEEVALLESIISKLDSTTYGLSAIKTMLNTVNTNSALLKNTTYGLSALKTLIDSKKPIYTNGLKCNVISRGTKKNSLPYAFGSSQLATVVYNNEIHLLGGDSGNTKHYKWNGTSWTSVSTLPYDFYNGCAVVYNNEIHLLGGDSGNTKHYKWNGTSWTSVSTLPYDFSHGCAVVYNNEIHLLGSNPNNTSVSCNEHYKWNGTSWTKLTSLPFQFENGCAVVYNNEIHLFGDATFYNISLLGCHFIWNGSVWIEVSRLPMNYSLKVVVYNNEIHLFGCTEKLTNTTININKHYKWDGSNWIELANLPTSYFSNGNAVVYNNEIHLLGNSTNHYDIKRTLQFCGYLPSGAKIQILESQDITPITNCSLIDSAIIVDSDGLIEFNVSTYDSDIKYSIF